MTSRYEFESRAVGGRPKRRESQASMPSGHPLRPPRQLAEWVEFLEKNACFGDFEALFGGEGVLAKWPPGHFRPPVAERLERRKSLKQLNLEAVHAALWPYV